MSAWTREWWNALLDHTSERLPVVIVRRSTMHRNERNAFELGVDAGALGQVAPSPAASRVVQLTGLPSGVVGFEISRS